MQQFGSRAMAYGPSITTPPNLASCEAGFAYAFQFSGTGGTPLYAYNQIAGTLPTGCTLSSQGVLSGTPSAGNYSFTLQIQDTAGNLSNRVTFSLVVGIQTTITTTSPLPAGTVGVAYSTTLTMSGAFSPNVWSLVAGSLDPGLSFNSSSGVISGTPTTATTYSPTFRVTDALGHFAQTAFSMTVNSSTNYVGANGQNIAYFGPDQPFINIFKQAGNNGGGSGAALTGWFTSTGGNDTGEENFLQLDADGYPTTLTALAGHTQTYTQAMTLMNVSSAASLPSGATQFYPGGSYTLQFQGAGAILFGRDVTSGSLATSSPNISVAGLTVTSTQAAGIKGTVTFNVNTPTANGMQCAITATDPSVTGNYIRAIQICQTSLVSNLAAGQIYHPLFKAALSGFSCWRGLKWLFTEIADQPLSFTATLPINALSGNLTAAWNYPTGTYPVVFGTGQIISVNATVGNAALIWSTPLSAAIPLGAYASTHTLMAGFPFVPTWSQRSTYTNAFWSTVKGIPHEVLLQLGNEASIDIWHNIPAMTNFTDPTYATKLAQLAFNGTGTTLPGFTGLKSSQKTYTEYANEVWNGAYICFYYAIMMGIVRMPALANIFYAGLEFMGSEVGNIGNATQAVYGAAYGTRAIVSMGGEHSNFDVINHAMNAADWVALGHPAPYTQNVLAYHTAPYSPNFPQVSAADAIAILGTANPLNTFFGLMYSGTFNSVTYASVGTGFIQKTLDSVAGDTTGIAGQPWANYPHYGYEFGNGWVASASFTGMTAPQQTAWTNLIISAVRDQRMSYIYYDPTSLFSANPGYLPALKSLGFAFLNQFELVNPPSNSGVWGALESVSQTISPLSAAPYKYQGIQNFIAA